MQRCSADRALYQASHVTIRAFANAVQRPAETTFSRESGRNRERPAAAASSCITYLHILYKSKRSPGLKSHIPYTTIAITIITSVRECARGSQPEIRAETNAKNHHGRSTVCVSFTLFTCCVSCILPMVPPIHSIYVKLIRHGVYYVARQISASMILP